MMYYDFYTSLEHWHKLPIRYSITKTNGKFKQEVEEAVARTEAVSFTSHILLNHNAAGFRLVILYSSTILTNA